MPGRQAVPPELLEFRLSMLLSKSRLRHKPEDDAPRCAVLRPAIRVRKLVDRRGVEPLTLALQRRRSTTELPAQYPGHPIPGLPAS